MSADFKCEGMNNMSETGFEDIISKPVGVSYEQVQTLGIYCWPNDEKERNACFFCLGYRITKIKRI